eukprot:gene22737-biopygen14805
MCGSTWCPQKNGTSGSTGSVCFVARLRETTQKNSILVRPLAGAFICAFPSILELYGCARMRPDCVLDTSTDGFEGFPPLKPPLVGSTWCPQKMVFSVRPAAYISSHACVKRGYCGQVTPDVPRGCGRYSILLGI